MSIRKYVLPLVGIAVLGGVVFASYGTRNHWMPYLFPEKQATPSGDAHDDHDHGAQGDRVKLSEQAQKNLALETDTLTPQEYWRKIMIPGMVVDRPGESDRGVTSKVAGVVIAIKARPGDTVKAGEPLFTLQLASEFLQAAQTDLARTAKEIEFAVVERDRIANLVKLGTTPGAELTKQQNVLDKFLTQQKGYRRQLQVFGLTPEQVDRAEKGDIVTEVTVVAPGSAQPVVVIPKPDSLGATVAPVVFEVQELKVTLGEQVQAGQILCLLAYHQHLYVEGRAFKSEADALAFAAENRIPIQAEFADETPGSWPAQGPILIHHLSNQVDPAARTFGFYLPLENQPRTFTRDGKTHFVWRYRPGQRVRLRVPVEKLVTLAPDGKTEILPFVLPAGAVVREGPEAFVFIQSGDMFRRKPVRILYEDRKEVVIANDGSVSQAEFVVKNQAAAINRALKAAAAAAAGGGGGHEGHSH